MHNVDHEKCNIEDLRDSGLGKGGSISSLKRVPLKTEVGVIAGAGLRKIEVGVIAGAGLRRFLCGRCWRSAESCCFRGVNRRRLLGCRSLAPLMKRRV
jgi:hypothetical protein